MLGWFLFRPEPNDGAETGKGSGSKIIGYSEVRRLPLGAIN
jgi:hypothetical protein